MNHGDQYSRLSYYLERRSAILDSAQLSLNGAWKERAQIATSNYRRLSEVYAKRNAIYISTKFGDRLQAFREILANGGYEGAWSLGRNSFIKDICLGIFVGPFLKSPGNVRANNSQ